MYGLIQIVASCMPDNYSLALAYQYGIEPPHLWLSKHLEALSVLLVPFIALIISGYIGLFFFKRWARTISLITTFVGLAVAPFFGPQLSSAIAGPMFYASSIVWGAILAIAYYSPLSSRFGANNSFNPTAEVGPIQ